LSHTTLCIDFYVCQLIENKIGFQKLWAPVLSKFDNCFFNLH